MMYDTLFFLVNKKNLYMLTKPDIPDNRVHLYGKR